MWKPKTMEGVIPAGMESTDEDDGEAEEWESAVQEEDHFVPDRRGRPASKEHEDGGDGRKKRQAREMFEFSNDRVQKFVIAEDKRPSKPLTLGGMLTVILDFTLFPLVFSRRGVASLKPSVVKRMAWCRLGHQDRVDYGDVMLQPPFPFSQINDGVEKDQLLFQEDFEGATWDSGSVPYAELRSIFQMLLENVKAIYVKGNTKCLFVNAFLTVNHLKPCCVNLERLDRPMPSLQKLHARIDIGQSPFGPRAPPTANVRVLQRYLSSLHVWWFPFSSSGTARYSFRPATLEQKSKKKKRTGKPSASSRR